MADCGATGTALDRAVAAATGTAASKQAVASLVGQASMASSSTTTMPAAPPTFLSTHPQQHATTSMAPAMHPSPELHQLPSPPEMLATAAFQHHHHHQVPRHQMQHQMPHFMQQQQQQQQQQHMMMMMQQQQQQMLMMQQQQQQQQALMMQQQQQQNHEQYGDSTEANHLKDDYADAETQPTTNKEWHEGLEEEVLGHEGLTQGATIEELAAAWAQAEAEYEDSVNLGAVYQQQENAADVFPYDYETTDVDVLSNLNKNKDWMKQAQESFDAGDVREAIQYCEAELQLNDENNASAWYLLGKCHAEQDEDGKAIACLERSVEMDPYSPPALLALGVSHVNELNHGRALLYLQNWMTHNPKYAGLDVSETTEDVYGDSSSTKQQESAFEQAQRLLLTALEHDPADAQVHEALGVVYNVSRDYDAAISSFQKALQLSGDSYSLENKLGATLANANRSEEALPHYHAALQQRPKYARAWLNMAISHSNLKNYQEAARCYLQTLSLNPSARHVWSYLRIALTASEKWDLVPYAAKQDLDAFADYYDFVQY